jgi:hypothetical protein
MRAAFYPTDWNKFMLQESADFMFDTRSSASIKLEKGSIEEVTSAFYFEEKGKTRD